MLECSFEVGLLLSYEIVNGRLDQMGTISMLDFQAHCLPSRPSHPSQLVLPKTQNMIQPGSSPDRMSFPRLKPVMDYV